MVLISRTHYKVLRGKYKGTVRKRPLFTKKEKKQFNIKRVIRYPKGYAVAETSQGGRDYHVYVRDNFGRLRPLDRFWNLDDAEKWIKSR